MISIHVKSEKLWRSYPTQNSWVCKNSKRGQTFLIYASAYRYCSNGWNIRCGGLIHPAVKFLPDEKVPLLSVWAVKEYHITLISQVWIQPGTGGITVAISDILSELLMLVPICVIPLILHKGLGQYYFGLWKHLYKSFWGSTEPWHACKDLPWRCHDHENIEMRKRVTRSVS